jgi:hypothetical protein
MFECYDRPPTKNALPKPLKQKWRKWFHGRSREFKEVAFLGNAAGQT